VIGFTTAGVVNMAYGVNLSNEDPRYRPTSCQKW